jgi:DNA-binding beta-propeller fold protein YncE
MTRPCTIVRLFCRCLMGWLLVFSAIIRASPVWAAPILRFETASTARAVDPHDLKLSPDGRYLWVSDVDNDRVAILDPDALELISNFGAGFQGGTHDVDFDAKGRAYIADTHNNRVLVCEMSGTNTRFVGGLSERIRGPEGVLAHPNGWIYVAGAWSGNVVVSENGEWKGHWGAYGAIVAA